MSTNLLNPMKGVGQVSVLSGFGTRRYGCRRSQQNSVRPLAWAGFGEDSGQSSFARASSRVMKGIRRPNGGRNGSGSAMARYGTEPNNAASRRQEGYTSKGHLRPPA